MRAILILVACLLVGYLAAWLWWGRSASPPAGEAPAASVAGGDDERAEGGKEPSPQALAAVEQIARLRPHAGGGLGDGPDEEAGAGGKDSSARKRDDADSRGRDGPGAHQHEPHGEEAPKLPPPGELDARFQERKLRAAIYSAMKEIEVEGEIVDVDCSEYPCAVLGAFDQEEATDAFLFPRMLSSESLSRYNQDGLNLAAFSRPYDEDDPHGAARLFFVVSYHPRADEVERSEELEQRFNQRLPAMRDRMLATTESP